MRIILESTNKHEYVCGDGKRITGRKIIIETTYDDLTLDEVIEDLIRPALVAYGFHFESVDETFKDE